MLKELKRVVYQVEDLRAARDWYARMLGSEPAFDSPVAAIFRVSENSLSLTPAAGPRISADRVTAYWEVEDVDRAFARLVELGAQPEMSPTNVLTLRVARVTDPFGNLLGLSGAIPRDKEQTVERQPSRTAQAVALCRALLARDERLELRREDAYSHLFLEEDARAMLEDASARQALIDRRISRPLYGFFAARCGFFDEVFGHALEAGVRQVVFLGAGYDTRTLRFSARLGDACIFEVDVPSTQGRKQAVLREAGVAVPPQVRYVSLNFETEDFIARLIEAGYDGGVSTLFVWEGVTYYLTKETVERTLARLHAHSTPGSAVVLDYMTSKADSMNPGEPFRSFVEPGALPNWMAALGWCVRQHVDAARMEERFLTLRDGTIGEKPFSKIRFAYAERDASRSRT